MGYLIKLAFVIFCIWLIARWFGSWGKYEGLSAKDWATEYDTLSDCIETRALSWQDYEYAPEALSEYIRGCL